LWSLENKINNSSKATFLPYGGVSCLTRLWRNRKYGYDFASGSRDDSVIRLWSLQKTRCVRTLVGHTKEVLAICELQNGFLASASQDETIKIWNIKISSEAVQTIKAAKCFWTESAWLFQFSSGKLISLFINDQSGCKVWAYNSSSNTFGHSASIGSNLGARKITKVTGSTFALLHSAGFRIYHENGDCLWIAPKLPDYQYPSYYCCLASLRNGMIAVGRDDGGLEVFRVQGNRFYLLCQLL